MKTASINKAEQVKQWAHVLASSKNTKSLRVAANGIYRAFYTSLIRYFSINGITSSDVQNESDLAMATLEKVFQKVRTYQPDGGQFSTWVFSIARNTMIDAKRREPKHDVISTEQLAFQSEKSDGTTKSDFYAVRSNALDPCASAIRSDDFCNVRDAMALLSDIDKQMLQLRFFEERTYEEIAEELLVPIGTVKAHIFRAKANLRNKMVTLALA